MDGLTIHPLRRQSPRSVALRILDCVNGGHNKRVSWNTIRLELAGTQEFPAGSVSRAFVLRLPLRNDGSIDEAEIARNPARATVRRFWASEADCAGRIEHFDGSLVFSYEHDALAAFSLPCQPIRLGEQIVLVTQNGSKLPFRVAGVRQFG